jgi:hypothetical protein
MTLHLQSRYPLQVYGLVLWLAFDAAALAESLAHLLYTEKRNPFMIWVPMRESQEFMQEQQQMLLDVSCSYMSIANSRRRDEDGAHPCLAPSAPLLTSSLVSIAEVQHPCANFVLLRRWGPAGFILFPRHCAAYARPLLPPALFQRPAVAWC